MKIIGLTGPTGSGKSTVSRLAAQMGFVVIDCDKEARLVTEKKEVLDILSETFGADIILTDGSLDRKLLAARAFKTKENTEILNKIMLPVIVREIDMTLKQLEKEGALAVLLDAPTLYESGLDSKCDSVVAVLTSKEVRKQRIMERDKISETDADLRILAGKDDEFYKLRAEHIIFNDSTEHLLIEKATKIFGSLI